MRYVFQLVLRLFVNASQGNLWAIGGLSLIAVIVVGAIISQNMKNKSAAEDEMFGTTDRGSFPDRMEKD